MPNLQLTIARAWWGRDPNIITYVVVDEGTGFERSLVAERHKNPGMWRLLHDALTAAGYTGPVARPTRQIESLPPL